MRRTFPARAVVLATAALAVLLQSRLAAHDPGLSALDVRVWPNRFVATITLSGTDARMATGLSETLDRFAIDAIDVRLDGRVLQGAIETSARESDSGLRVVMAFDRAPGSLLTIRSRIPAAMAAGHRQLLTIRDPADRPLLERMLDARTDAVDLDLGASAGYRAVTGGFLSLGFQHISSGYDHLLFVAALLLGIPAARHGRRSPLSRAIGTITAFTVAHSITLASSVAGLAYLPAGIVEPLIAASIVFVGVDNLRRTGTGTRWWVTFGFGLVHGFGFAGALRDLGLDSVRGLDVVAPLASFNVGVEIGQIAVAVVLWPLVQLATAPSGERWRVAPACSLAVAAAGGYWLIQRVL